jgi:DNA-binding PadR family transcriptional regulator
MMYRQGCENGRHGHRGWGAWKAAGRGFGGWGGGSGGDWGGDWGFGPGGGRPGNFRGGGRGRMFAGGELRLVLLKLIGDEPRHGYELIKAIEELTGGVYAPSPGTVYPTLSLLEDEGAIAPREGDTGSRKAFSATAQGEAELTEKADEIEAIFARLTGVGESQERSHKPELFRAMANLASVLKHRYRTGTIDKVTIEAIVDLIDDAAKKIERL